MGCGSSQGTERPQYRKHYKAPFRRNSDPSTTLTSLADRRSDPEGQEYDDICSDLSRVQQISRSRHKPQEEYWALPPASPPSTTKSQRRPATLRESQSFKRPGHTRSDKDNHSEQNLLMDIEDLR